MAEVLFREMPVEELEPETSTVAASGHRWKVEIPKAPETEASLRWSLAIREPLATGWVENAGSCRAGE
jgi:hypothetical protein